MRSKGQPRPMLIWRLRSSVSIIPSENEASNQFVFLIKMKKNIGFNCLAAALHIDFGRNAFIGQISMRDLLFVEPFNDLLSRRSHAEFPIDFLLEVFERRGNVILAKKAITKISSNAERYDARPNPGFSCHPPIGCR